MFEINPVLAGRFGAADYAPAASNINKPAEDSAGVDARRYTKFDRSAANDVASIDDLSFKDVIDIVNPLQHIPLVADAYRAITDDQPRPFARVAGDILYGGLGGGASAITSAATAVADATLESQTGHDMGGTLVAALFGDEETPAAATQLAAAAPAKVEAQILAQASASEAEKPEPVKTAEAPKEEPATDETKLAAAEAPFNSAKAFPLKQPFGGVIAPAPTSQQNTAIALAAAAPGLRIGHTIYTSPLMNGRHPLSLNPIATAGGEKAKSAAEAATAPVPESAPTAAVESPAALSSIAQAVDANTNPSAPRRNPLPPELVQDMMLKALNQYKSLAGGQSVPGVTVDVTN